MGKVRSVCVVTSARSDYGYIKPILERITASPRLKLQLAVTGAHLDKKRGYSVRKIEEDGFDIQTRIPLGLEVRTSAEVAQATANVIHGFTGYFSKSSPDIVLVIADRFEMFGATVAGISCGLIVAHISGGDLTEGSFDDSFRHAMTKLSHLHFPSNTLSARRIYQMGEEPWRVHIIGEPSLELLAKTNLLTREELADLLSINKDNWESPLIVTVHPETLRPNQMNQQITAIKSVINQFRGQVIFTSANQDAGGAVINAEWRAYTRQRPKTRFVENLGWVGYVSLMQHSRAMLGNSSSGLLEAPSFKLPVVNIGNRQAGRLRAKNVIDVDDDVDSITQGLRKALSEEFRSSLRGLRNPYWRADSTMKLVKVLETVKLDEKLRIKRFQQWPLN